MTDMDKMMIEERAREILNRHLEYMDGLGRGQIMTKTSNALAAIREALDDRLREALDNERGAKQLYKDFENTTDEHVELVFSANACPEHKALADEMREWFRAAVDAALPPLPQGDG